MRPRALIELRITVTVHLIMSPTKQGGDSRSISSTVTAIAKEAPMKSLLLLTASGPLLILTSHESLQDQKVLEVLRQKGIGKFVAFEVPLSLARERYGGHFHAVESNLHETDDLRILDFNGQRVFQLFRFDELSAPILQEQP